MESNYTYNLLHSKGNQKWNKKTTSRIGENFCKWRNWQGINHQNIQATHTIICQNKTKNKQTKNKPKNNQEMSRRSNREMQIKTTMRYYFIPVRVAIIKISVNYKCWEGCWEKEPLLHCWWEHKLVQSIWRTV